MTREFLIALGVDENIVDKITAENDKDIENVKSKFADYDILKSSLETANTKIEEFGKLDFDGVKALADDYKNKFETAQKEASEQLHKIKFEHALESALTGAKAKNIKAVSALLDTSKLRLSDDGSLKGFDEQIKAIMTDNDFLFDLPKEAPATPPPAFLGGNNAPNSASNSDWDTSDSGFKLNPIFN